MSNVHPKLTDFKISNFINLTGSLIPLFVFVFAFFEKINKESFVLNYANQKTRNLFLEMVNKSPLASVIVSTNGDIQFYNEPF